MLYYYWPNKRQSCVVRIRIGVRRCSWRHFYREAAVRKRVIAASCVSVRERKGRARTLTKTRSLLFAYTLTRPALSIIWILHGPGFIMTRNKTIVVLPRRARDNQANKSAFARENTEASNKIMERRRNKKRVIKSEFRLPDDTFSRLCIPQITQYLFTLRKQTSHARRPSEKCVISGEKWAAVRMGKVSPFPLCQKNRLWSIFAAAREMPLRAKMCY